MRRLAKEHEDAVLLRYLPNDGAIFVMKYYRLNFFPLYHEIKMLDIFDVVNRLLYDDFVY